MKISLLVREARRRLKESFIGRFGSIPAPELVIGGMQKSGTTAIAALLAKATGKGVTLDLAGEFKQFPVLDRPITWNWHIYRILRHYRSDFSQEIVKEPSLSVLFPLMVPAMPGTFFIMIVRDPRDCIRSILDRHRLPGDLSDLSRDQYKTMNRAWQLVFDGKWLKLDGANYIETLANRWQYILDICLENKERILVAKYEDFIKDKIAFIHNLADVLGFDAVNDISDVVNVQYQRKGNRNVCWDDFFGEENLKRIEIGCQNGMIEMGYFRKNDDNTILKN